MVLLAIAAGTAAVVPLIFLSEGTASLRASRMLASTQEIAADAAPEHFEKMWAQEERSMQRNFGWLMNTVSAVGLEGLNPWIDASLRWVFGYRTKAEAEYPVAVLGTATPAAQTTPLKSLVDQPCVLRRREVSFVADCVPIISPFGLAAMAMLSPTVNTPTGMHGITKLQQNLTRTIKEVPWFLASGGTPLPVQPGCLKKGMEKYLNQAARGGLVQSGLVKDDVDITAAKSMFAFFLASVRRYLRTRDMVIPAGDTTTIVGALRMTSEGKYALGSWGGLGAFVPKSLQDMKKGTREEVRVLLLLTGLSASISALCLSIVASEHPHYAWRVWQWCRGKRTEFPSWQDGRNHQPIPDPMRILREAVAAVRQQRHLPDVELEQGLPLLRALGGLPGPALTKPEDFNPEDDQEVLDDDAGEPVRCVICLRNRRAVMSLPCRHLSTCISCSLLQLLNIDGNGQAQPPRQGQRLHCPVCMAPTTWLQRVFL